MTQTPRRFPTAAEIEANTPPDRDRAIDVIRIAALVGVVAGHTVMATSMIADGVFRWGNLLTTSIVFQALTWVFQIMPLFFFAGVAASVNSYVPGQSWGGWLLKRCTRLYRPVFYYLGFWAVALAALKLVLPQHVYEPVAGISIQLLWFLGAYVLVLAGVPLLARITSLPRLMAAVGATYAVVAMVDYLRVTDPGWTALAYVNFAAWLIPGMFGVAYRRGLLGPRAAVGLGVAMLGVNVALYLFGPYQLSLVGIDADGLRNMTPPSLLLAGHAIMLCAFAIGAAPVITRWAGKPRVWRLAVIGNSGAMTLYLWHMPVLLGMHLVFDQLGLARYPGQPHIVVLAVVQVAIMAVLVSVTFVALRPLENNPLPLWDGGCVAAPGPRSAWVGVLLCVAGAATLASCAWGLKDDGWWCVAIILTSLFGARLLAASDVSTPATQLASRS
jgi:acyltransferase-like protein